MALNQLGVSQAGAGDHDAALFSFRSAISKNPKLADAYNNIALVHAIQGKSQQAIDFAKEALSINPKFAKAYNNLGNGLMMQLKYLQAAEAFRAALSIEPNLASANRNLGLALFRCGRFQAARDQALRTLEMHPILEDVRILLADCLRKLGDVPQAYQLFKQIQQSTNQPSALLQGSMASCALELKQYEMARHHCNEALKIEPGNIDIQACKILCGLENASLSDSRRIYLEALHLVRDRPSASLLLSRLIFLNLSNPTLSPKTGLDDSLLYAEWFEKPYRPWAPHSNECRIGRKLKIGYVSGDFSSHSVTKFFAPLLQRHDRMSFEIYLYSNSAHQDESTLAVRRFADYWVDAFEFTDDELEAQIRRERIDILVDLSGHTAQNRLSVFARKPAPIQATWIGMAGTTGLNAMDYRITTATLDPPGLTESHHTEKLVRIPSIATLARPEQHVVASTQNTTSLTKRFTFASLNQPYKINEEVVAAWVSILAKAPDSSLVVCHVNSKKDEERIRAYLAPSSIPPERIITKPTMPEKEFLEFLNGVDLALDTFPYTGGTTTAIALWAGVATISLPGVTTVSRAGAEVLTAAGLAEFVVNNVGEYISLGVNCAMDPEGRLPERTELIGRLHATYDVTAEVAARAIEGFYQEAWQDWCSNKSPHRGVSTIG